MNRIIANDSRHFVCVINLNVLVCILGNVVNEYVYQWIWSRYCVHIRVCSKFKFYLFLTLTHAFFIQSVAERNRMSAVRIINLNVTTRSIYVKILIRSVWTGNKSTDVCIQNEIGIYRKLISSSLPEFDTRISSNKTHIRSSFFSKHTNVHLKSKMQLYQVFHNFLVRFGIFVRKSSSFIWNNSSEFD